MTVTTAVVLVFAAAAAGGWALTRRVAPEALAGAVPDQATMDREWRPAAIRRRVGEILDARIAAANHGAAEGELPFSAGGREAVLARGIPGPALERATIMSCEQASATDRPGEVHDLVWLDLTWAAYPAGGGEPRNVREIWRMTRNMMGQWLLDRVYGEEQVERAYVDMANGV